MMNGWTLAGPRGQTLGIIGALKDLQCACVKNTTEETQLKPLCWIQSRVQERRRREKVGEEANQHCAGALAFYQRRTLS